MLLWATYSPRLNERALRTLSHVYLGRGVELQIDPTKANLDPDQVRALVRESAALLAKISGEDEKS